jgi:tetratricopeptide (TPR) repeat protein
LEAMIARSSLDAKEIAPYLASLLSIPTEGRFLALEMAPSEVKERTIAAMIALFQGLTRDAPVLALLEDAHWIDPTSLDVFGRLIEKLQGLRALLVVTFRPEFAAPWMGRGHVTAHALNRFGRRHAVTMIERVTGGKGLPGEVLEQIVVKTDGVPLFVEELTKTVLESELLREESGAYVLAGALTPLAIPSTLQDSLMARLDRLALVKEIAQIGAAIGREFSYRLLEAVSPITGAALQDALRQLMAAELIYGRGAPPEAIYIFKHALVQDTAYASLLRSRRQRIHAEIAKALVERFADQVEAAPAIIAHHYTEAGVAEPAARYWTKAAELALSRSAPTEASRYIDAGLALIPRTTDGQSPEVALQIARANALLSLKGINAPETVAALTAAKQLLDGGVGVDMQRFFVLNGLCMADYIGGRLEPALELARQLVEVGERQGDTTYRMIGHRLSGNILFLKGQNREALESLERAERFRDPARQGPLSYRFGGDPGLLVLAWKVYILAFLGLHDQAAQIGEQVRVELQSHGHAQTVAACNFISSVLPQLMFGDLESSENLSADLVAYCTEKGVEQFRLIGSAIHTCARAMREPTEKHVAAFRSAIDAERRSGGHVMDTVYLSHLAEVLLAAGDMIGAETALQEGFVFVERSGARNVLADLHRVDGRIALKLEVPDPVRAERSFLKAIEIARSQEAHTLELRAATDLARLWRDNSSDGDPRALLEPILAAIEGGETTRDVRNARALLAEIV